MDEPTDGLPGRDTVIGLQPGQVSQRDCINGIV